MPDTESLNPASKGIDALPLRDLLALMHKEDARAFEAVGKGLTDIEKAVEEAARAIRAGGKVFYIGAGTSGRLGVLDAAEVRPTFGVDCFRAIIAGGEKAVAEAVEGAEDDEAAGRREAEVIGAKDMAVGVSASGGTPFVISALKKAKENGARCWLITCNEIERPPFVDGLIALPTGPELIAGSTRLKAATATKLALNMLSTATMISLGGTYDGLMVDVVPSNKKLVRRAENIIMRITGCGGEEASELLKRSGMRPKVASLMKLRGVSREEAESLLQKAGGSLRNALKARPQTTVI